MPLLILAAAPASLAALLALRGSTPPIDARRHPHGLALLEEVPINGVPQWVLIRSVDVTNPLVLFVHGGPGTSEMTLVRKCTLALEEHFTVVHWDQRGAGKSFAAGADASRMNMPAFVDDVIDLSSRLAERFRKRRIVLAGHSWGSAIGLLAVSKRPDLFDAYVGIGQVSDMAKGETLSYEWTLERARAAKDLSSIRALTEIGSPPYLGHNWRRKFMTERRLLGKFGGELHASRSGAFGAVLRSLLFSTEYTWADRVNFFRGIFRSVDLLYPELAHTDLFTEIPEVKVPMFFCLGRHDYEVPSVLTAQYFEVLKAPRKDLVWFEKSAHLPNIEESQKFNTFMIETVLPAVT